MQSIGGSYPDCRYGERLYGLVFSDAKPYNSYLDGFVMRGSSDESVAKS